MKFGVEVSIHIRVILYLKYPATTRQVSTKVPIRGHLEFCKKLPLGSVHRRTTGNKLLENQWGVDASVDEDLDNFVRSCFL